VAKISKRKEMDSKQLKLAATSLLKYAKAVQQKKKNQLIEDENFVYMVIGLAKIPDQNRNKPYRVDIVHPIYNNEDIDLCLFVKDAKPIKERLEKFPVGCVKKVLSLQKLRTDFKDFESKRRLLATYDMFMAEKSILPMLPKVIGSKFFAKKKQPIPIKMSSLDLGKPVHRALKSTYMYLSAGSCTTIRVGTVSMSTNQLVENVTKALEGASDRLPRKFKSIKSLHLKTSDSVALPFYNKYPNAGDDVAVVEQVEEQKVQKKKQKKKTEKKNNKKSTPTKRKASEEVEKKETKKSKVADNTSKKQEKKEESKPSFVPAKRFTGRKPGYVFQMGSKGLGYYVDTYKPVKSSKKKRRKRR